MAEERLRRAVPKPEPDEAKVLDRIFVHDLVLDVEIGVYTNEKGVTQRVRFSVDVDVIPAARALEDDIGRAFDYDTIIKGIKNVVARGHINLVETLGEEVARQCLAHPAPRPSPSGSRSSTRSRARSASRSYAPREAPDRAAPHLARSTRSCASRRRGTAHRRQARGQRGPFARSYGLARYHRRDAASHRRGAGEGLWPTRCAPARPGSASAMPRPTAWRCSPWISSLGPWLGCGSASPSVRPKPSCAPRSARGPWPSGRLTP